LGEILAADPGDAQAWLTQASILQVQARYAEARASCAHLGPLGARAYEIACEAEIDSLTGEAHLALETINGLIAELEPAGATTGNSGASAPIPAWLVIIRAEMAERMGQFDLAERDYQAAVLAHSDAYAKAAYADFLLDRDRPLEVITLLEGDQRADPLLLRLALAYQAADRAELAGSIEALKARFAAAHLRGDTVHLREEARFTLHLENDPVAALRLAELDWAVQKEPADARGLLEAASLAHDRAAIETVKSALGGLEDQRLAPLLR
jgi:tetratricopeptide (TPR) repeat protein